MKTRVRLIGSREKIQYISNSDGISPKVVIDDEVVLMINEAKYLGMQIDKTFGWREPINTITSKISRGTGMLRYTKRYVPLSTIKAMCRSIVEPCLRYCCKVCGCGTEAGLKRLQVLQTRATRIVANGDYDAHSLPLIKGLSWLTAKCGSGLKRQLYCFQICESTLPKLYGQMFQRQREQAIRMVRNAETDLKLPCSEQTMQKSHLHIEGRLFGIT